MNLAKFNLFNNSLTSPKHLAVFWSHLINNPQLYCPTPLILTISGISLGAFCLYEFYSFCGQNLKEKFASYTLSELEKNLKEKFSSSPIIEKLQEIKNINIANVFHKLLHSTQEEIKLFHLFFSEFHLAAEQLEQILKGAHIRLEDGGAQYEQWIKEMPQDILRQRISSHSSSGPQYAIRGVLLKEFLFSKIEENGKTYTWFQLENSPACLGYYFSHMVDFFKYKVTGNQQGPYGESPYTDKNPLYLTPPLKETSHLLEIN